MDNLVIASTKKTPGITFISNGNLSIKGSSFAEDAISFYQPALHWIEEFTKTSPQEISLTVELEYINTSSTTIVLKILKKLKEKSEGNYKLNLVWKYDPDDEDSFELGDMIQKIIKHPVLMVSVKKD
ncbi:MAG: DUF1987 family protein [Sphingobacteriaceae bacterium]|nr:DUF1987 family protein [Sphingobacteriaceae bacterium]